MPSVVVLTCIAGLAAPSLAQEDPEMAARLMQDRGVLTALQAARDGETWTLADQVRLCEVPAPPLREADRALVYADAFRSLGLRNVRVDREGNVLGERPGQAPRPHLIVSAHLDTVFSEGTLVNVRREGTILRGSGIADDCRGLAVVLGVIRALDKGKVQTQGTITFVGTVGEEGLWDLRGVKALFRDTLAGRIDRFVSIDGGGLGMTHIGVGSQRYRITFRGSGGHSYGAFGMANPMHALGRAMAAISEFKVPAQPKTTFNIGRVGGGTSVNAIASEAWMEVDLRSQESPALQELVAGLFRVVDRALEDENARWKQVGRLTVEKQLVGDRPVGRTPADSSLIAAAVSVTRALRLPVSLREGSTDANIPMSLKIPAVTIEGSGVATGGHSTNETFDTTDSWQGTQRATLLTIALATR